MSGTDFSEAVLSYLRTDPACTGLRNLTVGTQSNILMSGDLTEEILNAAVKTRRDDHTQSNRILAVSIQDDGERLTNVRDAEQYVIVRLFDRGRGYKNIRSFRQLLRQKMLGGPMCFDAGCGLALKSAGFSARTGHRWDRTMSVDFEAIRFIGYVYYAADQVE